jgi:hypothetical protein
MPDVLAAVPSARSWYVALVGGVLPLLLVGFLASAAADRLVFVLWAFGAAAAYTVALHRTFFAARVWLRWAVPAGAAALSLGLFATLAARHWDELRVGLVALGPISGGAP